MHAKVLLEAELGTRAELNESLFSQFLASYLLADSTTTKIKTIKTQLLGG